MFAKTNWALIGLDLSLELNARHNLLNNLNDRLVMISHSQLAASAITHTKNVDSFGINPYDSPRLDETDEAAGYLMTSMHPLAELSLQYQNTKDKSTFDDNLFTMRLAELDGYACGAGAFQLGNEYQFGFWMVKNEWKDVNHIASVREHIAYKTIGQPYKMLPSKIRAGVDSEAATTPAAARKQFPVLLDFVQGRAYIQSTNKTEIEAVRSLLTTFGVPTLGLAWQFDGYGHWPSEILTRAYHASAYTDEFRERAKEAETIPPENYRIHEDPEIQSLVNNFYATTESCFDYWLSLSAKARIKRTPMGSTILAESNEVATSLLDADNVTVYASNVTIQERVTTANKKGVEKTFRRDAVTLVLDDGINMVETGAAMLRGFDVPPFRKDIWRDIRQTKYVPTISQFWSMWLTSMKNSVALVESTFRQVLGVMDGEPGGILPVSYEAPSMEFIEEAVAV